jgi:hypothetical protein
VTRTSEISSSEGLTEPCHFQAKPNGVISVAPNFPKHRTEEQEQLREKVGAEARSKMPFLNPVNIKQEWLVGGWPILGLDVPSLQFNLGLPYPHLKWGREKSPKKVGRPPKTLRLAGDVSW